MAVNERNDCIRESEGWLLRGFTPNLQKLAFSPAEAMPTYPRKFLLSRQSEDSQAPQGLPNECFIRKLTRANGRIFRGIYHRDILLSEASGLNWMICRDTKSGALSLTYTIGCKIKK